MFKYNGAVQTKAQPLLTLPLICSVIIELRSLVISVDKVIIRLYVGQPRHHSLILRGKRFFSSMEEYRLAVSLTQLSIPMCTGSPSPAIKQ